MGVVQSFDQKKLTIANPIQNQPISYLNQSAKVVSLVWLDPEVNKHAENLHTQEQLRKIIDNVKTFDDSHECQQYIQRVPMNHLIILIVSGRMGRILVPHIYQLKQISSIYVYCLDKQSNEQWSRQYDKVKAVVVQKDVLFRQIKFDLKNNKKEEDFSSIDIFIEDQSTTDVNGKYIHFLQLINMLLRMKSTDDDKRELIITCRKNNRGNDVQQSLIDEFERNYSPEKALWWYSRESFLYQMLNKALRKEDIELLYLFRWFIVDIQRELSHLQCKCPIRVFRGQLMSKKEIESLKKSIGKLILFNSFLSASLIEQQAIRFLKQASYSKELQPVLFKINADPQITGNRPFADVSSQSDFENEYEVLFMLGCIFRINNVHFCSTNSEAIVEMTLDIDNDDSLNQFIGHMKEKSKNSEPDLTSFGYLLWEMGKYDLAEKYLYRRLAEVPPFHVSLGPTYLNLGLVCSEKNNYVESLSWFEKSLMIYMQTDASNYVTIGTLYNNIGRTYWKNGDYKQAMESFIKAVSLFEKEGAENYPQMAMFYNNIGLIHHTQRNFTEALYFHEKSRAINLEHKHPTHKSIGLNYNNIGIVHLELGNYDLAIEYFERVIDIYRKSLPPFHPDLALPYQNIGIAYQNKSDWERAGVYNQKALDILKRTLPRGHPDILKLEQYLLYVASKL